MNDSYDISADTKAVLLLTAPLIVKRGMSAEDVLTLGEYNKLAALLLREGRSPADLLAPDASEAAGLLHDCGRIIAFERLRRLLERGLLLGEALARWQERALWVIGRADADYPARLKRVLGKSAPPLLYGCGDRRLLTKGGLAVAGSRHIAQDLLDHAQNVGASAARAGVTIVSGGAKGVDQAAMLGALAEGGTAVGVLADDLERVCLRREYRNALLEKRLTLISPYDPLAGFHVGNAMQRNKVIYALADAALIVHADLKKGGTWNGAVEQLEKFGRIPLYIRASGPPFPARDALYAKGAEPWPEPRDAAALRRAMEQQPRQTKTGPGAPPAPQSLFPTPGPTESGPATATAEPLTGPSPKPPSDAEALWTAGKRAIINILAAGSPMNNADVAQALDIEPRQAANWLERLVAEGAVEKQKRPVRYVLGPRPAPSP